VRHAELRDFRVDELLQSLTSSGGGSKSAAILSLGYFSMGYPALSMDDDVVYLICKAAGRGPKGVMLAVDVRRKELRGVAKLDSKIAKFECCYLASVTPRYLPGSPRPNWPRRRSRVGAPRVLASAVRFPLAHSLVSLSHAHRLPLAVRARATPLPPWPSWPRAELAACHSAPLAPPSNADPWLLRPRAELAAAASYRRHPP